MEVGTLEYGQILEIRSTSSSSRTFYRFYKHPDMEDLIVWEKVVSKKGNDKIDKRLIVSEDLNGHLSYHASRGFTEQKILNKIDGLDKKSYKKEKKD